MTDEKIYIAGKMSGIPEFNFPAFIEAEKYLAKQGYKDIVSPHKIGVELSEKLQVSLGALPKEMYMRYDFIQLLWCTHIYMLKDWENSEGAVLEHQVAKAIGIKIVYE